MKNITFLILLFVTKTIISQQIAFADSDFKNKLLQSSASNSIAKNLSGNFFRIDSNNNNQIEVNEALEVSYLNVGYSSISNIQEIFYFSNLIELRCYSNQISSLNLLNLTHLQKLNCNNNDITSLNLIGLNQLIEIDCSYNELETLYVENLNNLIILDAYQNQINEIDLNGLQSLIDLNLGVNNLNVIDLNQNINLEILNICCNNLSNINLNNNSNLTSLNIANNNINLVDITNLTDLVNLYLSNNYIENINLESNTNLITLDLSNNGLLNLDISNNVNLVYLYVGGNILNNILLENFEFLRVFHCQNNLFEFLDFSQCPSLWNVVCSNNPDLAYIDYRNGNNCTQSDSVFTDNPNLSCIYVDDSSASCLYNTGNWIIDSNTTFVETESECESLSNSDFKLPLFIVENPVKDKIRIETNLNNFEIELYSLSGNLIGKYKNQKDIYVNDISNSIYILKLISDNYQSIIKIIKE